MIPANTFTPTPIVSDFLDPNTLQYHPLTQVVLGGVALNDPSLGRMYKSWTVYYEFGIIFVQPNAEPVAFSIAEPDVTSVSLSFDNNMAIVLNWTYTGGAKLYYYDTLTLAYITRDFPGITSSRVCVDDAQPFYNQDSDVIFSYIKNNNLYWRQQRDRYDIERLIGAAPGRTLVKVGLNAGNRLQFKLI